MLKKTIKYEDFNGVEKVGVYYFNLTKAELTKSEISESTIHGDKVTGGFREKIQEVIDAGSGKELIDLFEGIIRMAYGEKSDDGERFDKSDEISNRFMATAAYDVLFMEIVTDADAAAAFINAIVPSDISAKAQDQDKPDASRRPITPAKGVVEDTQELNGLADSPVEAAKNESFNVDDMTQEQLEAIRKKLEGN